MLGARIDLWQPSNGARENRQRDYGHAVDGQSRYRAAWIWVVSVLEKTGRLAVLRVTARNAFIAIGLVCCLGALFKGPAQATGMSTHFPQCQNFNWEALRFRSEKECVTLLASGGKIWDLFSDFLLAPNQENPNPDSYGNADVWWFQYNDDGLDRNPAAFKKLPNFTGDAGAERQQWDDGTPISVRWPTPLIGIKKSRASMVVHPGPDQVVVTAWKSPVSGTVNIRGGFMHVGGLGSDGVRWFVDHYDGTKFVTLDKGFLPATQGADFGFQFTANVEVGDFLYFSVDQGGDNNDDRYDSTFMNLTISGPVHGQSEFVAGP